MNTTILSFFQETLVCQAAGHIDWRAIVCHWCSYCVTALFHYLRLKSSGGVSNACYYTDTQYLHVLFVRKADFTLTFNRGKFRISASVWRSTPISCMFAKRCSGTWYQPPVGYACLQSIIVNVCFLPHILKGVKWQWWFGCNGFPATRT